MKSSRTFIYFYFYLFQLHKFMFVNLSFMY